ncbi:hypothetical protein BM536_037985 [Streptomyces phaeoluteigriseus]|uniref:Zinc-finger domain-containing protein n=1 Tax=Streptomyces phaeoluteigriseus TaxID=114686 RepID=A0A1V6MHN5_9ACTN|nr:hypothetical protein [Streptomyces phaeoluteigriseus]OQD51792.1 hypothetical protein BM536_037985 [Streptomyces phaeoluteigriseus]
MVNCEQTREELAVQALTGDRHGGIDAESAEHLGRCAECSAERQRLAVVAVLLSNVGLLAFEGLRAADAPTVPRGAARLPREAVLDARDGRSG